MSLAVAGAAWAAFQVPQLTGPVVDEAGILSRAAEISLENSLRHLRANGGSQLQVLTVPSLGGTPIEQASIAVTSSWKLGTSKDDRGVLFLIARDERRMRIEVGQGNEGSLTDVQSKRIIEESVTPLFRTGDFDSGVIVGVYQIARATDPEIDIAPYLEGAVRKSSSSRPRLPINGWIIFVIFAWFIISNILGGGGGSKLRRRSGIYYGGLGGLGGLGGGRGWSSGGGGGGWSGGGGGFSGGGASGSW